MIYHFTISQFFLRKLKQLNYFNLELRLLCEDGLVLLAFRDEDLVGVEGMCSVDSSTSSGKSSNLEILLEENSLCQF